MRYYLLLLFSLFSALAIAQTYTVVIDGRLPPGTDFSTNPPTINWGDGTTTVQGGNVNYQFRNWNPNVSVQFFEEIPNRTFTQLTLRTDYFPVPSGCTPPSPNFVTIPANLLIPSPTGSAPSFSSCNASNVLVRAVPEMTITGPSGDICAGSTIDLQNAQNFPDEAYTWNFRLRNPMGNIVSGGGRIPPSFYTPNLKGASFNMIDLLGTAVENNIGNTVEFYLGANGFTFSNSVSIVIDDCTPSAQAFPTDALCSDGTGSVDIGIARPLNTAENEYILVELNNISDGFTIPLANDEIDSFDASNRYSIPENLIPGSYQIQFQSWIDPESTGTHYPNGLGVPVNFQIRAPSSVDLDDVVAVRNPSCPGDFGERRIEVSGGQDFRTGQYHFTKDGGVTWDIPINPNAVDFTYSDLLPDTDYTFGVKLVFSATEECISASSVSQSMPDISNPIVLASGSNVQQQPSSPTATNGILFVQVTGGSPNFIFELYSVSDPNNAIDTQTQSSRIHRFENLGVGDYFVKVRDSNGCEVDNESTPFVLAAAPVPSLGSPTITGPTCNNGSDGTISINATYPTATTFFYELRDGTTVVRSGNTTATEINITALSAGDYILYVIASTGDFGISDTVATAVATVTNPSEVTIDSFTVDDITCFGEIDGSINIVPSGGSNYEYSLELVPGPTDWFPLTGNRVENLAQGSYYLTIRNENGCQSDRIDNTNILIDEPDEIIVNDLSSDATTNGGFDASIALTITGGTPFTLPSNPYSISWEKIKDGTRTTFIDDDLSTPYEITGLEAATYEANIMDANGCSSNPSPVQIIIDEPGPLNISNPPAVVTDVDCFGDATGRIEAQYVGTPPFEFVWFDENDVELKRGTEDFLDGQAAGVYYFTINDVSNAGPIPSPNITIGQPASAISATISPSPSCFGENTGSISISNVNGGTSGTFQDYTYSIDDGASFQNGPLFEGLAVGDYIVVVRDGNNCDLRTPNVLIGESPQIQWDEPNSTVTNVSAQGLGDGSISPVFNGGFGNFTFVWNGPNVGGITDQNIFNLGPGNYSVLVTDENGCSLDQAFEITEPGPLSITNIIPTDISCFGADDGSIATTVTGEAPITYTWIEVGVGPITTTAEDDIENLSPGTYTLTVDDASTTPPVISAEITISEPNELTAQAFPTDINCAGDSNGSILVNAIEGTPGYEYSIDGGANYQPNNTFNNLAAGNYTIRIRDNNQCTFDVNATINEPLPIGITIDLQQPLSAAGASDGAISITAFGGTGTLTYNWAGPAGTYDPTSPSISDLPGGDYTVTITDANGCPFVSDVIVIAEPGELLATIDQTVLLECNGDDFGEITAAVQGGVTPYTYEWFETTTGSNTLLTEDADILADLSAGSFFLRVTDANGTRVDTSIITITEPGVLEVTLDGITDVLCSGESTGTILTTVTGGTMPYNFIWNNGETTKDLTNVPAGDYSLDVVDANGCIAELDVTVNAAPDALQIADVTVTNSSTYQANDGSIALNVSGGATPYNIFWTRDSDGSPAGTLATLTDLAPDTYAVIITDANGCNVSETYEITEPDIVEETIVQPTCQGELNGSISVVVNRGNGAFTYAWSTGETTNVINNLGVGAYTVTITGLIDGPLTRTYTIEDPLPLEVDLGANRVLCVDQVLELDASVDDETATYSWTSDNGFSSAEPNVVLTTTGNYMLTVQTASGCTAQGTIFVDISTDEIDAEFAMSSQVFVGETVVAVDISFPLPETIEWVLPEGTTVLKENSDEVELVFNEAGEYEIGIITTQGDCIAQKNKKVLVVAKDNGVAVEEGKDPNKLVEDFIVYPNPTTGRFTANVSLSERGGISIKVFNFANNAMMASERGNGATSYSIPFDISGMPSGVYAVLLETPYGTSLRKIIVR